MYLTKKAENAKKNDELLAKPHCFIKTKPFCVGMCAISHGQAFCCLSQNSINKNHPSSGFCSFRLESSTQCLREKIRYEMINRVVVAFPFGLVTKIGQNLFHYVWRAAPKWTTATKMGERV